MIAHLTISRMRKCQCDRVFITDCICSTLPQVVEIPAETTYAQGRKCKTCTTRLYGGTNEQCGSCSSSTKWKDCEECTSKFLVIYESDTKCTVCRWKK